MRFQADVQWHGLTRFRRGIVVFIAVAGCFHDPDANKLVCQVNEQCPQGYWCTTEHKCSDNQSSADGSAVSVDLHLFDPDSLAMLDGGPSETSPNRLDALATARDTVDLPPSFVDTVEAALGDTAKLDTAMSDAWVIDAENTASADVPVPGVGGSGGTAGYGGVGDAGGAGGAGGVVRIDASIETATGGITSSGGSAASGGTASGGTIGSGGTTSTGGAAASIVAYPASSSIDFGTIIVGQASNETTVTLTNAGQQPSGPITVTSNSSQFVVQAGRAGDCASGTTILVPAASCTARILFKPTNLGPQSAVLAFNATPGGAGAMSLLGAGISAAQLSTGGISSLSFGTVIVAASSPIQGFTITNTGQQASGPLTLTISDPAFILQTGTGNDCIAGVTSLASTASCMVRLTFAPTTAGLHNGSISFTSSSGANGTVALGGTGCGANACGGCGALGADPGTYCGSCKTFACSPDKTSVICSGTDRVVKKLALGTQHSCAVLASGGVRCWGNNNHGQLGDGGAENTRATPDDVLISSSPLVGASAIALAGNTSCVIVAGGAIKCWGNNQLGQAGDGTTVARLSPVDVLATTSGPPITGALAIASEATADHFCATFAGGTVKCWGLSDFGQIGNVASTVVDLGGGNTAKVQTVPIDALTSAGGSALAGATGITVGESFTCALLPGALKCWGRNRFGALGDGTLEDHAYPANVVFGPASGTPSLTAVSAGEYHTCAIIAGSYLDCWGSNSLGGLGDGTLTDRPSPTSVLNSSGSGILTGAVGIRAAELRSCALMANGGVKCWGGSPIGDGGSTWRQLPVDVMVDTVTPIANVADVAMGSFHTCVLLSGGTVRCWGTNSVGQLGDGTAVDRVYPVDISVCP